MDPRSAFLGRLQERGVPLHALAAIDMNVQDESSWNPSANEAVPLVPGSRGGFGLMQWTGPRRVALEQYAADRGRNPADAEVQADFFMTEIEGPERNAWSATLAQGDPGQAAAVFAAKFLRPAEEHLRRREARYTGNALTGYGGMGGYENALRGTDFNPNAEQMNALTAALERRPDPPMSTFNPSPARIDPRYASRFS